MEEKPKLSYFVNTGMYILNEELLQEIPADTFFPYDRFGGQIAERGT